MQNCLYHITHNNNLIRQQIIFLSLVSEKIVQILKSYLLDAELILFYRQKKLDLARTNYTWDIEQNQFIYNVKSVIAS
jgi:hypothetical protein